jgi:prepilin-type processing-associated H-X9-DG protein
MPATVALLRPDYDVEFMSKRAMDRGLTLVETVLSLCLIAALLSILLPALNSARVASYRDQCSSNQREIGKAWHLYLEDHNREYPYLPLQPGWLYGGVRFSAVDGSAFPDSDRPLTSYLPLHRTNNPEELCVCCPADRGITDPTASVGTGRRTALRSFGTSYRANAMLFDADLAGIESLQTTRGLRRSEIIATPSRLILLGDPIWYEAAESTRRGADWHGPPNAGNILFLDGSVRFITVKPRSDRNQPIVFDPIVQGSIPGVSSSESASPRGLDQH